MENKKTKVSVFVAGQRFNILTEKSEKYVLDIASEIDARISSLVFSQNMSRERAAVLTALDYADDGKMDKENIAAVKEQIKDYLQEVERLQENNAKLISDYNLLKTEYERLIEEKCSAEEAQKALIDSQKQISELKAALFEKEALLEEMKQQETSVQLSETQEAPLPEEIPAEEKIITAEDDLFFGTEEEEPIKPQKKKKNRHEHSHVNPYQQKAKQKEQGYTQQRQYSFFELNEE